MLGRWISLRDTACFQGRTVELQECNDLILMIWWWFVNLTEGNLIWWFIICFTVPEQTLANPLSYPYSSFGFSGVLNETQFIELHCVLICVLMNIHVLYTHKFKLYVYLYYAAIQESLKIEVIFNRWLTTFSQNISRCFPWIPWVVVSHHICQASVITKLVRLSWPRRHGSWRYHRCCVPIGVAVAMR